MCLKLESKLHTRESICDTSRYEYKYKTLWYVILIAMINAFVVVVCCCCFCESYF